MFHVLDVWLEEAVAEEGLLEVAREGFEEVLGIRSREERLGVLSICLSHGVRGNPYRSRITQISYGNQICPLALARRPKRLGVFIFVNLPYLIAKLLEQLGPISCQRDVEN